MHAKIRGHRDSNGIHTGADLEGFRVEATDGHAGKVVYVGREEMLGGYFVVATGLPHFGRQMVLPVAAASLIDVARRTVHVDRTRAEIKAAPEVECLHHAPQPDYAGHAGHYYSEFYASGKV